MPITFSLTNTKTIKGSEQPSSIKEYLQTKIENGKVLYATEFENTVKPRLNNGLIGASYSSYSNHYHLILSPDDIWITILTSIALYIDKFPEEMRNFFVNHSDKMTLEANAIGDLFRNTKGIITQFISQFSDLIEKNTKPNIRQWMESNFTTTTENTRMVSQMVMMGALKHYFHYSGKIICGIPKITLEGTENDWKLIKEKIQFIRQFPKKAYYGLYHTCSLCEKKIYIYSEHYRSNELGAICLDCFESKEINKEQCRIIKRTATSFACESCKKEYSCETNARYYAKIKEEYYEFCIECHDNRKIPSYEFIEFHSSDDNCPGYTTAPWNAWVDVMEYVLDHFINVFNGEINIKFWQSIIKETYGCGGPPDIYGWILAFSPFDKNANYKLLLYREIKCTITMGQFKFTRYGVDPSDIPSSIITIPLEIDNNGVKLKTEIHAGVITYQRKEYEEVGTIKPCIGWGLIQST